MSDFAERITLNSWSSYKDYLSTDRRKYPPIYRGQSNPSWQLASPFERTILSQLDLNSIYPYVSKDPNGLSELEEEYYAIDRKSALKDFVNYSIGCSLVDVKQLEEFEQWVVGRHYGLITPILDWSISPYVAAWFAYRDIILERWDETEPIKLDGEVSVWELDLEQVYANKDIPDLVVHEDPRIPKLGRSIAQQSYYTELNNHQCFELEGYLSKNGAQTCLKQIILPINGISQAIKDLSRMNIHCRTMFDDLTGAAEEANWRAFRGGLYAGYPFGKMDDGLY